MESDATDKNTPAGARDGHRGGEMGTQERRALGSFRKVSKPLMEKKRRARINLSLEQLKGLLEKHYSHQIRKRKLEKADILELSVKYMRSLQQPAQGLPATESGDYQAGFRSCLQGVRQFLLGSPADRDFASWALPDGLTRARPLGLGGGGGFSTTDSGHGAAAVAAAFPEPRLDPPGSPKAAPTPGRRRARPLKPQARASEGEDSIPGRADWSQGPSGQDRLPARIHPLWRPW